MIYVYNFDDGFGREYELYDFYFNSIILKYDVIIYDITNDKN